MHPLSSTPAIKWLRTTPAPPFSGTTQQQKSQHRDGMGKHHRLPGLPPSRRAFSRSHPGFVPFFATGTNDNVRTFPCNTPPPPPAPPSKHCKIVSFLDQGQPSETKSWSRPGRAEEPLTRTSADISRSFHRVTRVLEGSDSLPPPLPRHPP